MRRSRKPASFGRASMKRPSPAGIVPQNSSMRGWKYSVTCRMASSLSADLAAHAGAARRARLQVGDADHVVVAHGVGDMLCRGDRQRVAMRRVVQRHRLVEPVEIFAAIGEVLIVDDLLQPARRHVAQAARDRRRRALAARRHSRSRPSGPLTPPRRAAWRAGLAGRRHRRGDADRRGRARRRRQRRRGSP